MNRPPIFPEPSLPMSYKTPSLTDELARERNREAADCTLLAWVQPSLAMISLGFGIKRLGQAAMGFDGPLGGDEGATAANFPWCCQLERGED